MLEEGPDQEQVDREPDRPAPVGVATEHPAGRLGRLVLDLMLGPAGAEAVGMVEVPPGDRADPVRAQETFLVQHPRQNAPQLVLVHQGQQPPAVGAGHQRVSDVGQEVLVALQEGPHLPGDLREALQHVLLDHRRGAQRQQAHQRTDLDPGAVPSGRRSTS